MDNENNKNNKNNNKNDKFLKIIDAEDLGYLGSGSFARVKKAKYNNQLVAIKILHCYNSSKSDFQKEVDELSRSNHENIIKFITSGQWKERNDLFYCLVVEFADTGSLHHVLHETCLEYTLGHAISWLLQTARAVNYLHTRDLKPTIHRDLKPLNLLLTQGGTLLKVCDFGTACNLRTMMTANKGTADYIAPEVISDEKYDEKCDVFSYAVIIFEVLSRQHPYFHLPNPNSNQIMFGVVQGKYRPLPIKECPSIIKDLLKLGLDRNPNKRPSMKLILSIMEKLNALINKTPILPISNKFSQNISESSSESKSEYSHVSNNEPLITGSSTMITPADIDEILSINDSNGSLNNNHSVSMSRLRSELVSNSNKNFELKHRKSRSIGNYPIPYDYDYLQSEKEFIKEKLNNHIEFMLYDPIEPNKLSNRSIEMYKNHKKLIDDDELLQKNIDSTKQQLEQLNSILENVRLHKELHKQKLMILEENDKLRHILANQNKNT